VSWELHILHRYEGVCDTFLQDHTERDEGLPAACELQDIYKQTEGPVSRGRHKEENRVGIWWLCSTIPQADVWRECKIILNTAALPVGLNVCVNKLMG